MKREEIRKLARVIWDYHHMHHRPEKADCLLVLGSNDLRVAEHAAKLFLDGFASVILFSGGNGRLTENWTITEAERFANIASDMGVPKDLILIENKSTNTGENIIFSKKLLENKGIRPQTVIVVTKPYMERRAFATFKKIWPDPTAFIASPPVSFEEYPTPEITEDDMIQIMVGDLQRIKLYPEKGFQIVQEIPSDVWDAYEKLVQAGYTQYVLEKNEKEPQ